jgi:NADH-quinone oxidoreductase subunit L
MPGLLWLVPAFPFLGFLALALSAGALPKRLVAAVGVGSVGLSALAALATAADFLTSGQTHTQLLWHWMTVGDFSIQAGLYLDSLSLVMMLMVTFVGFLIHLYSAEHMAEEEGYNRFFAYMNLFVAAMLTLVLADNLLFLYLGWEGVGLCSYLLIGFWYRDPANGLAARKAFLVTRVGDTAMMVGLLLLFTHLGTLDIQGLTARAAETWPAGSPLAVAAAALLLGGALGKSAQLPLQTWLPDAMAGPTPVSALIHAATMVTAGVYLIARTRVLFTLAPEIQELVAVIGAWTLLLAATSALAQTDIKRVLAYSTISQIGYMFLALGVGAWSAAIFHFMTHAFFKALLFLSAGVVIQALDDEHDIHRMGGLRRELPSAFWPFLIGSASLAALPLVTAGAFSKDLILLATWSLPLGGPWLWAAGWIGALLTGLYIFRVVFLVFFGAAKTPVGRRPGWAVTVPLAVLAVFSVAAGWVETPFVAILHGALPETAGEASGTALALWAAAASLAGIAAAYFLFLRAPGAVTRLASVHSAAVLRRLWRAGWGFDHLYDRLLVRPFLWMARADRNDFMDIPYQQTAGTARFLHRGLSLTQTGRVRWYAAGIAAGAVVALAVAIW